MTVWDTTAVRASGVTPGSAAGGAVVQREKVLTQTQAAEDAVMRPADPGAWSYGLRAVLAARIAGLHADSVLRAVYLKGFESDALISLSDADEDGARFDLAAVVSFMDRVAVQPREIQAEDIQILQDAGIGDADIVRLCELNAFLSYQIRLVAGLRLMARAQA